MSRQVYRCWRSLDGTVWSSGSDITNSSFASSLFIHIFITCLSQCWQWIMNLPVSISSHFPMPVFCMNEEMQSSCMVWLSPGCCQTLSTPLCLHSGVHMIVNPTPTRLIEGLLLPTQTLYFPIGKHIITVFTQVLRHPKHDVVRKNAPFSRSMCCKLFRSRYLTHYNPLPSGTYSTYHPHNCQV